MRRKSLATWQRRHRSSVFVTLAMLAAGLPAYAQESSDSQASAVTALDVTLPVDQLHVALRPLTKDQLERELDAWLGRLSEQISQVGAVEIELKALADDEPREELTDQLVALRTEESEITERTRIVLAALEEKGGDVESARQYVDAVSDLSETTDATSRWAAVIAYVKNWAGRDDGGKYWARRMTVAVVIVLVFWVLSRFSGRIIARALARHPRASSLLENFARRTTGSIVFVVGLLMALNVLGVPIGPLMAALGAGGFIVGFALQETLGSFASGLMIMVYRPFDVDDYVEVAGVKGIVKEMSLVSTTLLTFDNKVIVIPNRKAWSETIVNFTGRDTRRVDLVFGIGYDDNIDHAIEVVKDILSEHQLVLDNPPALVHVDALADSSVNLFCRPWVKTENYWVVQRELLHQVKVRFDAEGISIPYPQRDVHLQPAPDADPQHIAELDKPETFGAS